MELAHGRGEEPAADDLDLSFKVRWRGPLARKIAATLEGHFTALFNVNEADVALMLDGLGEDSCIITWDTDMAVGCPKHMLRTWHAVRLSA